jgi:sirohydrochlorin cobaltochelatase
MFLKTWGFIIILILAALISSNPVLSSQKSKKGDKDKSAIIVASFGTTVPRGIEAITNITDRVKMAFPDTEVRITFTSNFIRSVWRKRQDDPQKWLGQGVPEEILYVKNIISVIGDLREEGYRDIIVQPTHIFYMEQSYDLNAYVQALGSINTMKARWRPFDKVVMGRPALGMPGDLYDYHDDVAKAVETLAEDAALARVENATLIYMGHGNELWSTGIYGETQKKMRETYPEVDTFIGVAEGSPALEDFLKHLEYIGKKKVILKPFMIVAGNHAVNDMAGEEDSWKSILQDNGYQVEAVMEGLGSNNRFADLFVDHIKDTARDHGIILH